MSSSANRSDGELLLVAALHPGPLQKLAVLLLGHALAALLDDRAHRTSSQTKVGRPQRIGCSPDDRFPLGFGGPGPWPQIASETARPAGVRGLRGDTPEFAARTASS